MKNRRKKSTIALILLGFAFIIAAFGGAARAQTLDKTTLIIRANTTWDYNRATDKMGWLPQMDFRVNGPVPNGSQINVEMTTPNGKPWISFDCETTKGVKEGEVLKVEACGRGAVPNEKFTGALGVYGLKINLKNGLQGANQTLFTGKFKIGKAFNGATPADKDNYKWYVDYDWALPIAEIFADSEELMYGEIVEKQAQPLVATFWYRGDPATAAYLFYNGQEIGNTETTANGTVNGEQGVSLFELNPFSWTKKRYTFTHVLVKNTEKPDNHSDAFRLDKNAGEYEIKVLMKGKLARVAKFTVGKDGRIVDTGISRQNALGTNRITLFAAVSGDEDGRQPDFQAWKTTAFFDSPLKGFGL